MYKSKITKPITKKPKITIGTNTGDPFIDEVYRGIPMVDMADARGRYPTVTVPKTVKVKKAKPTTKKPRPFARVVKFGQCYGVWAKGNGHFEYEILEPDYGAKGPAEKTAAMVNAVAESWHAERCTACGWKIGMGDNNLNVFTRNSARALNRKERRAIARELEVADSKTQAKKRARRKS